MAKFFNKINIKNKKRILLFLLIFAILLPGGITLSKYIAKSIKNYILESNNFFFNSDKLTEDGINYEINNWGGSDSIQIQFQLNNYKNNILSSESDITYSINATCDSSIICSLDNNNGIIYKNEKIDNVTLTINPTRIFNDGESININVTATSSSPYVKELSASFKITVGKRGISYEITDEEDSPYLIFSITNSNNLYKVKENFDTYSIGDILSVDVYLKLSDVNKLKCYCTLVTLSFDPNYVVIDTTQSLLKNADYQETSVNGVNYINRVTFDVDAMTSKEIRFYKKNISINYTYPIINDTPIINFSAI